MPAYDVAWRTVGRAIDSILDQDYQNWELIIVKNGMKDQGKIRRTVKPYLKDPRIKLLIRKDSGACYARNQGAKVATGDFFSFFSSDFVLKPGMLRHWLELFRDNKEYGMIYGGYGWNDPNMPPYRSQDHDEYLLTRGLNYIDGGFPIRKEYFVEWDENLKSLNDWEWVINLVKHGCKPLYDFELAYDADLPKPGGLSYDSASNWLERVKYIKQKHNIPESPICVSSLGAPFHGIKMAKFLNADFKPFPTMKPSDYKLIYLMGFYCGTAQSVQSHSQVFNKTHGTGIKKVIHWIGSDIQGMMGMSWGANRNLVDAFRREKFIHLCECGATKSELAEMGIDAHIVPLPVDTNKYRITPAPKEPVIAIYHPDNNQHGETQYNLALMRDIAESMPDVKFKFFGGNTVQTLGNLDFVGYIKPENMQDFIDSCSAIVRITVHDGLPILPIEFLMSGREAILTLPGVSGSYYVGHGRIDQGNYGEKKEETIKAIREVINSPMTAKEKLEVSSYWREKCAVRNYKEVFNDILKGKYDA